MSEPADHLVSELDYAAYVTAAESQAWKGDDAANAREWKLLRDGFIKEHLHYCAFGVADAVLDATSNEHVRLHALLLKAVVGACMP